MINNTDMLRVGDIVRLNSQSTWCNGRIVKVSNLVGQSVVFTHNDYPKSFILMDGETVSLVPAYETPLLKLLTGRI